MPQNYSPIDPNPVQRSLYFYQDGVPYSASAMVLGLTDPDKGVRDAAYDKKRREGLSLQEIFKGVELSPAQEVFLLEGLADYSVLSVDFNSIQTDKESTIDFYSFFMKQDFNKIQNQSNINSKIANALKLLKEESPDYIENIDERMPHLRAWFLKHTPDMGELFEDFQSYMVSKGENPIRAVLNEDFSPIEKIKSISTLVRISSCEMIGDINESLREDLGQDKYLDLLNRTLSVDQEDASSVYIKRFIRDPIFHRFTIPDYVLDKLVIHPSGNIRLIAGEEECWRNSGPTEKQIKYLLDPSEAPVIRESVMRLSTWGEFKPTLEFCEKIFRNAEPSGRRYLLRRNDTSFSPETMSSVLERDDRLEVLALLKRPDFVIDLKRLAVFFNKLDNDMRVLLLEKEWDADCAKYKPVYLHREFSRCFSDTHEEASRMTFEEMTGVKEESLDLSGRLMNGIKTNNRSTLANADEFPLELKFREHLHLISKEEMDARISSLLKREDPHMIDCILVGDLIKNHGIAEVTADLIIKTHFQGKNIDEADSGDVNSLIIAAADFTNNWTEDLAVFKLKYDRDISKTWVKAKPFFGEKVADVMLDVFGGPDYDQYDGFGTLEDPSVRDCVLTVLDELFDYKKESKSLLLISEKLNEKVKNILGMLDMNGESWFNKDHLESFPNVKACYHVNHVHMLNNFEKMVLQNRVAKEGTGKSSLPISAL